MKSRQIERQTLKTDNMTPIINTKNLLDRCERWSKEDRKNRTAAVMLSDEKNVYIHYSGNSVNIAKCINAMINEDDEVALNVFKVVTLFAHKHFTPEVIKEANMVAQAIADIRKEEAK